MAKLPIVIDTDIGTDADDVIALSMALAESDRLELLGVIATGSAVEKRALYAKRILSCHQAGKVSLVVVPHWFFDLIMSECTCISRM